LSNPTASKREAQAIKEKPPLGAFLLWRAAGDDGWHYFINHEIKKNK
jgi:hypothetical protein